MTFRILTVCTGNICRSPLAEQLLRRELAGVDAVVSSAGTGALVGHPMADRAAAYSRRLGGEPDAHAGRQLTSALLRESDLVLVATRRHRKAVVELLPRASRSTFTLREFARLLGTVNPDDRAEVAAEGDAEPVQGEALRREAERGVFGVEGVHEDDQDREVQEHQPAPGGQAQGPGSSFRVHRRPPAAWRWTGRWR